MAYDKGGLNSFSYNTKSMATILFSSIQFLVLPRYQRFFPKSIYTKGNKGRWNKNMKLRKQLFTAIYPHVYLSAWIWKIVLWLVLFVCGVFWFIFLLVCVFVGFQVFGFFLFFFSTRNLYIK